MSAFHHYYSVVGLTLSIVVIEFLLYFFLLEVIVYPDASCHKHCQSRQNGLPKQTVENELSTGYPQVAKWLSTSYPQAKHRAGKEGR
jgi:hypothetical protein